jgi:hypothetical protein
MVVAFGWFGVVLYFGGYRGEVANALVVVLLAPVAGLSWWFGRRWRGG